MLAVNAARAAPAATGRDPQVIDRLGHAIDIGATTLRAAAATSAAAITAELIGSDQCTAIGITARAHAPPLALCRQLIEAGINPDRPLHVYRGETLALIVRSIGEGAALTVEDNRLGTPRFRRWRPRSDGAALPMRQNGSARHRDYPGGQPMRNELDPRAASPAYAPAGHRRCQRSSAIHLAALAAASTTGAAEQGQAAQAGRGSISQMARAAERVMTW